MSHGLFLNAVISFALAALAVFMLIKGANRQQREGGARAAAPELQECPCCFSTISTKATRCADCTSILAGP